jgi:hypothetical protein
MSTNINLLLRTDEESLKRKKRTKILNIIAIISLTSVCLISIIIFILIQIANPESIRKQWEDVLNQLAQFKNRQDHLFVVNNRVENIDKLLRVRKDLSKTTNSLLAKMPSQFSVNNFEVDDKLVVISGQSMSLFAIGEFINNLTDMARKKEIIKSLTLNSLSLDVGRNTYQISVKADL